MSRDAIDAKVLDWIAEGVLAPADEERFEELALQLFRFQHAYNEPYRRICSVLGVDASEVRRWEQVPAVPTGAFKQARLACFPPEREVKAFRTSGTTTERPGVLHLDTLRLYESSLLATFRAWVCPDVERIRFAVIAPSAEDAPDSSLSHMFSVAVAELGTADSAFWVGPRGWRPQALIEALAGARAPVAVVGTAFGFVHLLEALEAQDLTLSLPEGSRALETGGFKGRSRELERAELHGAIGARLGIPAARIVNQYGMCELGSQFYEPSLRTGAPSTLKQIPPWVRVRVVDPATLDDVPRGARGALALYDLANTGSVLAVQTSDAGRLLEGGFEVLGRLPGAEARGCSIAADALLGGAP